VVVQELNMVQEEDQDQEGPYNRAVLQEDSLSEDLAEDSLSEDLAEDSLSEDLAEDSLDSLSEDLALQEEGQ